MICALRLHDCSLRASCLFFHAILQFLVCSFFTEKQVCYFKLSAASNIFANASCHVGMTKPRSSAFFRLITEYCGRTAFCGYSAEVTGATSTSVSFKISLANSYHEQLLSLDN